MNEKKSGMLKSCKKAYCDVGKRRIWKNEKKSVKFLVEETLKELTGKIKEKKDGQ